MRTTLLCLAAVLAAVLLVSATVWEGVSDVAAPRDLPRAYSVATNSFPRNSMVDITNLENGRMVRVIVIANLETTGLLATLSRNAADAIDLRHDSTCRIRMTLSSDNAPPRARGTPAPQFQPGPIGVAENQPAAAVATSVIMADEADEADETEDVFIAADGPDETEDNLVVTGEPAAGDDIIAVIEPAATEDNAIADTEQQSEPRIASGTLTLTPAEERIPPAREQPAAVPRNTAPKEAASRDAPLPVTRMAEPPAYPPADFSPFQAPLISNLEQGKWYVQIGVYSLPDNVEDEISRIGPAYPVAIQNIGSDTRPMFRVLLGPLNQGESGAMLQRFKSIGYADAFVRHN